MRRYEADMPDMTSMIDVVFLMVIFFVITAAVQVERREDIVLEHTPHGDSTPHGRPLEIDIDRSGAAFIAGRPVSPAALATTLKRRAKQGGAAAQVTLRADSRATHGQIRPTLDLCKETGIRDIAFAGFGETRH